MGTLEIHPLVITSVCDHYTRLTLNGSLLPCDAPTIGLLFGTKDNNLLSICDATEAVYKFHQGTVSLQSQFIEKKKELWTAVYTAQELIGWYAVGTEILPLHVQLHQEILPFSNSLVFLLMSPDVQVSSSLLDPSSHSHSHSPPLYLQNSATNLPLSVYDFDSQQQIFVHRPFQVRPLPPLPLSPPSPSPLEHLSLPALLPQLQSSLVEKIAIDQVLKCSPTNGKSPVEIQNDSLLSSIHALVSRIDILVEALENMKSGKVQRNEELLRQISQISLKIPPNIYLSDSLQQNMNKVTLLSTLPSSQPLPLSLPPSRLCSQEMEESLALSLVNMINTEMATLSELYASYHTLYDKPLTTRFR